MIKALQKMIREKKEYRRMKAKVEAFPTDYRFVYDKIQKYMWNYATGDGYDMVKIHYDLIDLFEAGAADGKPVLEITGDDVAAFCDELLQNAKTYTGQWHEKLNEEVMKRLKNQGDRR